MTAACFPHRFQLSRADNRQYMPLRESQSNRALVHHAGLSDHVIEGHGMFAQTGRSPLAFLRALQAMPIDPGQDRPDPAEGIYARVAASPLALSERKTRAWNTARASVSRHPVTVQIEGGPSLSGAISHKSAGGKMADRPRAACSNLRNLLGVLPKSGTLYFFRKIRSQVVGFVIGIPIAGFSALRKPSSRGFGVVGFSHNSHRASAHD
jgi:hypothetical protein